MAAPTQPQTSAQPFAKGSIIWRKYGPLPVWAWALILLGILLAFTVWRRNKAGSADTEEALAYVDELPGDQTAPPVFINQPGPTNIGPINVPITTVPGAPPGGGRPNVPTIPKPGAAARRYMIRPDGSRLWIDPPIPGQYSGLTQRIPYSKGETAPRRYREARSGGGRIWLDLLKLPGTDTPSGGRYGGNPIRVR